MGKINYLNYKKKLIVIVAIMIMFSLIFGYTLHRLNFSYFKSVAGRLDNFNRNTSDNKFDIDKKELGEEAVETFETSTADGTGMLTAGVTENLITSRFWTKQPYVNSSIVMNQSQITEFNSEIIKKVPVVNNLENYKSNLSKDELKNYINFYKIPSKQMYFSDGRAISQEFYNSVVDNENLEAIKDDNTVSYGLCIKKSSIRDFPTDIGVYSSSNSTLDRIQETGCEPCEPVIVLHTSKDKRWYFVQIYNYRGWIKADGIAIGNDKKTVFDYANNNDFLMVTGKKIEVNIADSAGSSNKEFTLGTKLFLVRTEKDNATDDYNVKIPDRNSNGELTFIYGKVSHSQDVCIGYLPYTRYNVVKEAFKLLGTEYDWGDRNTGRDCSSFIMYVYKTFGFNLPRNTDEQEACSSNVIKFYDSDDLSKRNNVLNGLKLGDALYMPGHTMMYLGEYNGRYYIIHDFLGNNGDGSAINQVAVTTVNFQTSQGVSLLQQLTSAVKFQLK